MLPPSLLSLVWEPIASPLKIGGGAVVLAGLAVFAYARIAREHPTAAAALLVMRLGMIAAVTALLFGPSRELPQSRLQQRPRLNILVDSSESMLTEDCAGKSRIRFVAEEWLAPQRLRALRDQFEVDLQRFDVDVQPLTSTLLAATPDDIADGKATHLADSVSRAIARLNTDGPGDLLLVISDGRDTEDAPVQPVAELAGAKELPIFTIGIGGDRAQVDAAVLAIPLQDALLPGEPGGILVKVYQSGLNDSRAELQLKSGEESQTLALEFGAGSVVETQFNIEREEPGQYEFEVALAPQSGEADLGNNSQTVFVEVMKRKIRVLMLEGEPFWDSKFLAQSLRKDEQIELTQITQLGTSKQETIVSRRAGGATGVPAAPEEWGAFDVVVLGRGLERLLTPAAAESLAGFVRDGGHVVFARGPAWDRSGPAGDSLSAALRVLEPVVWGDGTQPGLNLTLTPSGRTAAWFATTKMGTDVDAALTRLGPLEELAVVEREKSGALVLARAYGAGGPQADELPAIARMSYGRGQSIAILGAGLWRWSLLPPELQDLRGFYDTFWSNLVRWLALGGDFQPGQQVSLQLSRSSARLGDELTADVVFRQPPAAGANPQLVLRDPAGKTVALGLHELPGQTPRFRATFKPEQTGIHELTLRAPGMTPGELSKRFNVYEVNLERLQTGANTLALQMLAEHSGGAMFGPTEVDSFEDRLQQHREALLVPPQREYLWDRGIIMVLLLTWAGVEWLFRRAAGLW
jgi:hypothetical protein